jgi:hypothetical protein
MTNIYVVMSNKANRSRLSIKNRERALAATERHGSTISAPIMAASFTLSISTPIDGSVDESRNG